jgi:hypothetical protein
LLRDFFTGAGELFPDEFVGFSAACVNCFGGGGTCKFAFALLPLPPLNKIISGTLIPDIASSYFIERNKASLAGGFSDLFYDADALF